MGLQFRRRLRIGPLVLNFGKSGLTSVALKVGPFTWNLTHGTKTTNLPDGFSYRSK